MIKMSKKRLTYKIAGVDRDANVTANELAMQQTERTRNNYVADLPGLFSGGFTLTDILKDYKEPLLVHTITGVDIEIELERDLEERGAKLVQKLKENMPANTEPLFISDYVALGKLDPYDVEKFVKGMADQCLELSIPIISGETAEMPDVLKKGKQEFAATLTGIIEKEDLCRVKKPQTGCHGLTEIRESYKEPILMTTIDGVGTKTKIGVEAKQVTGLPSDIIHHTANDMKAQGGNPIIFAYFIGCHKNDRTITNKLEGKFYNRCDLLNLDLIASEVLEKPDSYYKGQYDIVGSMLGVVDKNNIINGSSIMEGDILIGIASDGIHTNGYTLARRIFFDRLKLGFDDTIEGLGLKVKEELLKPHKDYSKITDALISRYKENIKGIAHITGGGFPDNVPRVIPEGLGASINLRSWKFNPIFKFLKKEGNIKRDEMLRTFNCGIGYVYIIDRSVSSNEIISFTKSRGEDAYLIGVVEKGKGVRYLKWA